MEETIGLTLGGMIFMGVAWAILTLLVAYCFIKVLQLGTPHDAKESGDSSQSDLPA